jgi:membrane-associated phospholipid phosphatase
MSRTDALDQRPPRESINLDRATSAGKVTAEQRRALRDAFDRVDVDRSGVITVDEVALILKNLKVHQGEEMAEAKKYLRGVDKDSDGSLNFDEFCRAMSVYDASDKGNSMFARVVAAAMPEHVRTFARMQAIVDEDDKVWREGGCCKWFRVDTYHWWVSSYWGDWAVMIFYLLVGCYFHFCVKPYNRVNPYGNATFEENPLTTSGDKNSFMIDKPHRPDTVTVPMLMFGSLAVPPIAVVLTQQFFLRSLHDMHHFFLANMMCFSMSFGILEVIKLSAGRLRPDYVDRIETYGNGVDDLDLRDVLEAHLSFPSGHSALSAFGSTMFSMYLAGKTGVFLPNGGQAWKILLITIPQMCAWGTAVSRTRDYRHNFSDVVTGYLFGAGFAALNYYAYFHPLSSPLCFYPKSREDELVATRPGYKTGDQTLRLQMIARQQGGCMFNAHTTGQTTQEAVTNVAAAVRAYNVAPKRVSVDNTKAVPVGASV